jgi:low temperature requirement protein LtrA
MASRDSHEEHRSATPLELFFDLCFVVAVALAASGLHHEVAEGHIGEGVFRYSIVFFAIWWAWMNFTWFASAYDTDDGIYRITTFIQMAGVLVLAAGVPRIFESSDFGLSVAGYVIMRLAMVAQWLRAAQTDPPSRSAALRYATGIALVQLLWVARVALPDDFLWPTILLLIVVELSIPVWAERAVRTAWHPHHIAERYGLFTIIVLGESILAATTAIQSALDAGLDDPELILLAISGLVLVFSMWWLYFDQAEHPREGSLRTAFTWGYGHLFVFAAAAAVGAGIAVEVDYKTEVAQIGEAEAALSTAVPVALYLVAVWLIHVLPNRRGVLAAAYPGAAALSIAAVFTPARILGTSIVVAALVALMILLREDEDGAFGDQWEP